jgi:hypothetical protein
LLIIGKEVNCMSDLFRCPHTPVDRFAREVIETILHICAANMSTAEACAEHGRIHGARQNGIDADIIRANSIAIARVKASNCLEAAYAAMLAMLGIA